MQLLLDTHALLWWLYGDERLPLSARSAIAEENNQIFVSAASAWEIATKFRIGKLPHAGEAANNLGHHITMQQFHELPISLKHAQRAGLLSGNHRDPFDRMLIAQAMIENMVLISNETLFDQYAIQRLW